MASSDENAAMLRARLDKIEDKVDDIRASMSDIAVIAAKQAVILDGQHDSLAEHMRRTALLETKAENSDRNWDKASGALKLISIIALVLEAYHYWKN